MKVKHGNLTGVHLCAVSLVLLVIQALASGFFPGSNRGFNLPVSAVSFMAWSYRGLLQNEFLYHEARFWSCPASNILDAQVALDL